jgi:nitroreductase
MHAGRPSGCLRAVSGTSSDARLDLSAEQLLTTTRAVRRRLDFTRPVPRDVLRECVRIALQAPSGSNKWPMQFVIVTDEAIRRELGEAYREAWVGYEASPGYIAKLDKGDAAANEQQQRTARSAEHLAAHIHEAPAIVLSCALGRADGQPAFRAINLAASVHPGMWSFMLAARLHGLGTCWTGVSLNDEPRTAQIVGIPVDEVTICALSPVAYTQGTDFKPALRPDPDDVIHWERW